MKTFFRRLLILGVVTAPASFAAMTAGNALVATMMNFQLSMNSAAYYICLLLGTFCLIMAYRNHHDWPGIATSGASILGIAALCLTVPQLLLMIPGVGAAVV